MTTNKTNHNNAEPRIIGVLFCGGCNPTYNRELLFRQLKQHYEPLIHFDFYRESETYELLLIINGCSSECLISQAYPVPFVCLDSKDVQIALQKIDNMLP